MPNKMTSKLKIPVWLVSTSHVHRQGVKLAYTYFQLGSHSLQTGYELKIVEYSYTSYSKLVHLDQASLVALLVVRHEDWGCLLSEKALVLCIFLLIGLSPHIWCSFQTERDFCMFVKQQCWVRGTITRCARDIRVKKVEQNLCKLTKIVFYCKTNQSDWSMYA